MKKVVFILSIIYSLFPASVLAQSDDFGLDISVGAEKDLLPGLELGVNAEMRTQDDTKRVERYLLGAELGYKFYNTKKFDMKVSGGFEYMWTQKPEEVKAKYDKDENGVTTDDFEGYNINERHWRNRHRTSLGLSAEYSPSKRWSFQLKETVQYSHYCEGDSINQTEWRFNDDDELYSRIDRKAVEAKDRFVLRSKLTVEYNIKGIPLNPFASVDYGCGLNYTANKWKYSVGADYNINKQNRLTLYYRFQTEDDDDEPNGHIVGLGYKVKF